MKIILIVTTILFSLSIYSQTLETIRVKKKIEDEHGYKYKVEYYALKSDTSVKHGVYKRYDIIKDLEETGFYKNGIKDSIWRTYSGGKMINSEGYYENGKKEGEWKFFTNIPRSWKQQNLKSGSYSEGSIIGLWTYYKDGVIEQKYDHSKDSLIYSKPNGNKSKCEIKMESGTKVVFVDRPPLLIGGNCQRVENWKNLDHSKLHTLSNGQPNVRYAISFWVNIDGSLSDFEMVKSVNEEYDSYIIEYYKNNYKWIPAIYNKEKVKCRVIMSDGYIVKM